MGGGGGGGNSKSRPEKNLLDIAWNEFWYKNQRFSFFFQNGRRRPSWISEHAQKH